MIYSLGVSFVFVLQNNGLGDVFKLFVNDSENGVTKRPSKCKCVRVNYRSVRFKYSSVRKLASKMQKVSDSVSGKPPSDMIRFL
jgi:hypothetical protein